jgi:hypothetical protein
MAAALAVCYLSVYPSLRIMLLTILISAYICPLYFNQQFNDRFKQGLNYHRHGLQSRWRHGVLPIAFHPRPILDSHVVRASSQDAFGVPEPTE